MRPICCGSRRLCRHEGGEAKCREPGEGRRDTAKIDDHRLAPPADQTMRKGLDALLAQAVGPFQSRVISERKLAQAAAVDFARRRRRWVPAWHLDHFKPIFLWKPSPRRGIGKSVVFGVLNNRRFIFTVSELK